MLINYWNCKYCDHWEKDYGNGEYESVYFCDHKDSKDGYCDLNNKYFDNKAECSLAEEDE